MALTPPLKLTRDQLATFLKDQRQIRAFENLFAIAEEVDIVGILEVALTAGNADAKAQQALDSLQRILDAIGLEYVTADAKAQQALDSIQRIEDNTGLDSADAKANQALSSIQSILDNLNLDVGFADSKAQQALDMLARITAALETLIGKPEIQHNNSVVTDYIDLPINGPHATKPRRIQWNEDDGTVDVGLYGDTALQVGQEILYYAKNTSGGTITNGTPVMFTGTVGASGKLEFGKAVANGTSPSEYMMGVATQDILNNEFGYIASFGLVRGWDTTGSAYGQVWSDGDLLYFDPTFPGSWTNVQPAAPNIHIPVAVVVNAGSGGSGSIFVRMQVQQAINDIQDVFITAPAVNEDVLLYNGTNLRWENTPSSRFLRSDQSDTMNGTLTVVGQIYAGATTYEVRINSTSATGILEFNSTAGVVRSNGTNLTFDIGGTPIFETIGTAVRPSSDGTVDLGTLTRRWDDVYAVNGTIQTSDLNEKQDIEELTEAETTVALKCKSLLRKFRWKSAVEEKGDDARIHFGIIAQDLRDAFESEGLDAGRYGMFIEGEDGKLGVRYSELLAFIIAAT